MVKSPIEVENPTTNAEFLISGLNSLDTYYWRVDVISACGIHVGRIWMFRLAQLAFPGAEGYGYVWTCS